MLLCARTVPSWFNVCFIAQAFTSHMATTLPEAVASKPLLKNTTALTYEYVRQGKEQIRRDL